MLYTIIALCRVDGCHGQRCPLHPGDIDNTFPPDQKILGTPVIMTAEALGKDHFPLGCPLDHPFPEDQFIHEIEVGLH